MGLGLASLSIPVKCASSPVLGGAAAVQVDLTAYAMQVELTAFTKVWLAMTEQFYQAAIDNAVEGVAQARTCRDCALQVRLRTHCLST